ncbi:Cytochrome P450 [Arachis hypogaea]|nr:Cytochrome P450 [Arachis hypogaea]
MIPDPFIQKRHYSFPMFIISRIILIFMLSFFTFTFFFSIFSFLLFSYKIKPWCNCHACCTYLNMSWITHFLNHCDWYTHLLRPSTTRSIHIHVLDNNITSNPDSVYHILKTKFHNYPKGTPFSTPRQAI